MPFTEKNPATRTDFGLVRRPGDGSALTTSQGTTARVSDIATSDPLVNWIYPHTGNR